MATVLRSNNQTVNLSGGSYIVSTFLNGGSATLQLQNEGSANWLTVGALKEEAQQITLPKNCKVRLVKTGAAEVELAR